ncbi:MAG: flagellar biosynthetic protein FliR [Bryobacteraceae bacterium]
MTAAAAVPVPGGMVAAFLAVAARVGGAVAFVPMPGFRGAAAPVRVALVLALTMVLLPAWPRTAPLSLATVMTEAVLGLGAGVMVAWLNEAFVLAMQFVGIQAGYTYASTIDPATQADSTVLQTLAQLAASALFVGAGFDRELIRLFARSLAAHPPGQWGMGMPAAGEAGALSGSGQLLETFWPLVANWTGAMFQLAFRLALPVIGLLLLVDLTLALLGRLDSHLQLLTVAFPLKMLAAMLVVSGWTAAMVSLYGAAAAGMWEPLRLWLEGPPR